VELAYAIMSKQLEDFRDLSTGELKFYLQQRALTCHGNHADFAACALVAFEQNLPIKETAETCLSGQKFILGRSSAIF